MRKPVSKQDVCWEFFFPLMIECDNKLDYCFRQLKLKKPEIYYRGTWKQADLI